jgi:uncharacterized protein YjiS (DUF1127 family)
MRPDQTAVVQYPADKISTPPNRDVTPGQFLWAGLIRAVRWTGRQLERRRSRLALLEMTDEQLKDIGLSRGEAYSEFNRRPCD